MDKRLSVTTVVLHGANVRFVVCRADFELVFVFLKAFQSIEGVGANEGVTVGDVLLPASGLPFSVFRGEVRFYIIGNPDFFGNFVFFNYNSQREAVVSLQFLGLSESIVEEETRPDYVVLTLSLKKKLELVFFYREKAIM